MRGDAADDLHGLVAVRHVDVDLGIADAPRLDSHDGDCGDTAHRGNDRTRGPPLRPGVWSGDGPVTRRRDRELPLGRASPGLPVGAAVNQTVRKA